MAAPPIATPREVSAAQQATLVAGLELPGGWELRLLEAEEREGRFVARVLAAGPSRSLAGLWLEVPIEAVLGADGSPQPTDVAELRQAIAHAEAAVQEAHDALADWIRELQAPIARADAVGDRVRLLCRAVRDGEAAPPRAF